MSNIGVVFKSYIQDNDNTMSSHRETEQRIREAAYHILIKHGYADLLIKDIGVELIDLLPCAQARGFRRL